MSDKIHPPDDEYQPHDPDDTRPFVPINVTRNLPPPPATGEHVRLQGGTRRKDKRKRGDELLPPSQRSARSRRDSGLYLPVWSILLMLMLVVGIAFTIVLLVYALGGKTAPGGAPRVVIITAFPSNTPSVEMDPTLAAPTLAAEVERLGAVPAFSLEGPMLPTVALTPTREALSINKRVRVVNVGLNGLRVRPEPGIANRELFIAAEGETFDIIDGPENADGLTWWRVQDPRDRNRAGWAAENDGTQDTLAVAAQTP